MIHLPPPPPVVGAEDLGWPCFDDKLSAELAARELERKFKLRTSLEQEENGWAVHLLEPVSKENVAQAATFLYGFLVGLEALRVVADAAPPTSVPIIVGHA